ncbi:hypothetical protein RHDE110596_21475 [Prescottella defluvii]
MLTARPAVSSADADIIASARVSPATKRRTSDFVPGARVTALFTLGDRAAARMAGRSGFDRTDGVIARCRVPCAGSGSRSAARRSP